MYKKLNCLQTHFDPCFKKPLNALLQTVHSCDLFIELVLNVCGNSEREREREYISVTLTQIPDDGECLLDLITFFGLGPGVGVDDPDSPPLDIGEFKR